ncbi:MAG: YraN family protein [Rhodobacteraceae bacterium]|nr:YraN family protein [Paracoccaceae bacterium]
MSGQVSHLAGLAAEDRIAADYARRGHRVTARRWRGPGGEIDLIAENGDGFIFIEVKKSRSIARAAERLGAHQMQRIYASASAYLADCPNGQDTDVRFDVALMDATGAFEILENAFAA